MVAKILSPEGVEAKIRVKSEEESSLWFETYDSDFGAEFSVERPPAAQLRNYKFYFFYKNEISDTETFQVRINNESVGWCVPISALDNSAHKFSELSYYKNFAFSAFNYLITEVDNSISPVLGADSKLKISSFYERNVVILAIADSEKSFELEKYIPFLFSMGFFAYRKYINYNELITCIPPEQKYIELSPVNADFYGNSFVVNMFKSVLVRKLDALAAFLLNYQIYEQMIHISFERKLDDFKSSVASFVGTSSDLKDTLKDINKINDELTKLKDYISTLDFPESSLHYYGKKFYPVHCDEKKEHFAESLYSARNKILHNYRNLSDEAVKAIDMMNLELFELTPKLICSPFRKSAMEELAPT